MMDVAVPRLHLVGPLGRVVDPADYIHKAVAAAIAGVDAIHIRLPGASGGEVLDLARALGMAIGPDATTTLIVNDRVDVALLAGSGVHLRERSIPVAAARALVGFDPLIGRSVHDVEGARLAEEDEADYLFAGHIYETDSKPGQAGRGLDWLGQVCEAVAIPVIAIGGISAGRAAEVLARGAWGVAVGREILDADDAGQATAELLSHLR